MAEFLFLSGRATANASLSECKPGAELTSAIARRRRRAVNAIRRRAVRDEQASPHEQPKSVPQFKL